MLCHSGRTDEVPEMEYFKSREVKSVVAPIGLVGDISARSTRPRRVLGFSTPFLLRRAGISQNAGEKWREHASGARVKTNRALSHRPRRVFATSRGTGPKIPVNLASDSSIRYGFKV
ncbi:hypothetical protein EVAR_15703_1 [Eumeta japonica]|uniref:Uncharacterized protein n=1 Tax=Eumeta variegata TaxID=151549 RepID=A0A4C1U9N2_EUMVA|nr:hypothetical protein EVAR_15703_1 [Eumeta japonica]